MASIKIGSKVPTFAAKDSFGNTVTSKDLIGKTTVIFFYPKDNTPGCTKEACGFQKHLDEFKNRGVQIIGVSPDNETSHKKFLEKFGLNFTLLTDVDKEISFSFGVFKVKTIFGIKHMGIVRSTFIIDNTGTIIWMESGVKVSGHVERVLSAIQMLVKP